jgi:MFS-type transporter involved in bile tolerance (Atg22 family)
MVLGFHAQTGRDAAAFSRSMAGLSVRVGLFVRRLPYRSFQPLVTFSSKAVLKASCCAPVASVWWLVFQSSMVMP